jgi:hypothetical protein
MRSAYSRSIGLAVALAVALSGVSCATGSMVTPEMRRDTAPFAGETACLVRGLGGPLTSYVGAGREVLEGLGFKVESHEMTVSANALQPCAVIVAHSAGALSALATTGPRLIFIIDGFATLLQHCPAEATCTNFYNPGDVLGGTLAGGQNINCFTACGALDAIPLLGHMTMPASREVWRTISQQIGQRAVSVAANERTP